MSESLEELKSIRDGTPVGAKFITVNGCYSDGVHYYDGFSWLEHKFFIAMRSLSDINRIIELEEWKIEANLNHQNMLNAYLND